MENDNETVNAIAVWAGKIGTTTLSLALAASAAVTMSVAANVMAAAVIWARASGAAARVSSGNNPDRRAAEALTGASRANRAASAADQAGNKAVATGANPAWSAGVAASGASSANRAAAMAAKRL